MNSIIEQLAEFVDNTIVQNDYPGFEPRSFKLGLPDSINNSSPRVFAEALHHDNIYVRLAALRWFQANPGKGRGHEKVIASELAHEDDWVKMEALRALEMLRKFDDAILVQMVPLLQNQNPEVRKTAAKALGKVCGKQHKRLPPVLESLRAAAQDSEPEVRWKAQKALRLLGEYES